MTCCIAALYLPLFYKRGTITSKFMVSIFDISAPFKGASWVHLLRGWRLSTAWFSVLIFSLSERF